MAHTSLRPQIEESPDPMLEELGDDVTTAETHTTAVTQLRFLWEERVFLGKAIVVGLILGLAVAFLIPPKYDSTVQLMPPDQSSGSGMAVLTALTSKAGSGNLGALAGDLLGSKTNGAVFVGVLNSTTVQERLVKRFDLKKVYSKKLDEDARKKLAQRTSVGEDRKSGIISINVTDRDPNRAASIAAAYVEELNQLVNELSTSSAHRERVFLEERLTSVKKDLDDASVKFSQFASKNAALDIKEQGKAMVEAAARLQGELIAAQSELAGLEQIYMPNNIRVRAIQARIGELQNQLGKLGGDSNPQPTPSGSASNSFYPSIRQLPLLGVAWADLYRNTKIQETVFETLTQQYELAKVQEAKEIPSVKVLDKALVPETKSFPPRTAITILGGVLALSAAIGGLFLRVRWNETDDKDEGKVFAKEVFHSVTAHIPWGKWNGSAKDGHEQPNETSGTQDSQKKSS